jgi:hypothetical protein
MTLIAGIIDKEGTIHLVGDSLTLHDSDHVISSSPNSPKVYHIGRSMICGISGDARLKNLLQHVFEAPEYLPLDTDNPMGYLLKKFIPAMTECFQEHHFLEKEKEVSSFDGTILLGLQSKLYLIATNLSVSDVGESAAIGAGSQYTYGSFAATDGMNLLPKVRLEKAALAAEKYSPYVRGPFSYLSLEKEKERYVQETV